jgi:hypothetical protein
MDFSLFFAWQSDSPLDDNKHLIRDAAREAVKRVSADADVEESPRLDHDTKGLSGTPEVASTIFSKIEQAGMFLGDVTFVGSSRSSDGREKKLPNMNVAIEMGYAGRAVGWERIILVMNRAYGDADEQVFDIKHRRNPITFDVPADSVPERRKEEKRKLSKAIEEAMRARLKCEHEGVQDILSVLDQHCLEVMVTYSPHQSFPGPTITTMGQSLASQATLLALARMLELRLLRCVVNYNPGTSTGQYAYHWTYLGRLAARQLGIIN